MACCGLWPGWGVVWVVVAVCGDVEDAVDDEDAEYTTEDEAADDEHHAGRYAKRGGGIEDDFDNLRL